MDTDAAGQIQRRAISSGDNLHCLIAHCNRRTCSVKSDTALDAVVYVAVMSVTAGCPDGLLKSKATRMPSFSHAVIDGNAGCRSRHLKVVRLWWLV